LHRRAFHKLAGVFSLDLLIGRGSQAAAGEESTPKRAGESGSLWSGYLMGAAYYPEWWPAEEWEVDFREMRDLGINAVRMGEFAWAMFERAPGKFDFDWTDRALAVAGRYGIRAILATPTASIPPWLYELHPDVLTGDAKGLAWPKGKQ
jgi:beta-galactosidase GanA